MEISSSSKTKHGSYYKADDLKYDGIIYLHLTEISSTKISAIVQIKLSTVKKIIKRFQKAGSPLSGKSSGRSKIVNKRTERHLVQIVCTDPFANYDQLRLALREIEIFVCRATVISSLRNLGFGSYIAAHKPALTERHKKT
ncbi:Homeodomain-like DNA binding domain-containing transcription factor [Phycomyces blakesleeanus NRRL 1555(-)]|uniref:Homeodomain-like DNA binding domain-containing transcription factor n=1 Tax=Phycomyces blakesleeanus (strain ATCC 8743b / DSM 1359 / FGSC 10004 / NBRC 33097 / NRRL 1555) TaxID=763407 RepID=A0A163ED97_PHYB8|nr:Homeodomain-like DNA binding domain-containing transcription factor [Phycomyces blakesleeanus NRRL 1555(-)]OAD78040.1 Homeodomain-like DNA binding domain-containing transcription factor [Phycomyces blakesleeanus NRRL 1555(-)]|eukprot:XP_018296080.1 Homeodomain-like DNA binding domain-containing transcription factor [Phycomyces blakesleeanus NRRL 1555(-)]